MSSNLIQMIWESTLDTLLMVLVSGGIGAVFGIPPVSYTHLTLPTN